MFPHLVPANQFKKVMLTSLVDENSTAENFVVKNLDISVFET